MEITGRVPGSREITVFTAENPGAIGAGHILRYDPGSGRLETVDPAGGDPAMRRRPYTVMPGAGPGAERVRAEPETRWVVAGQGTGYLRLLPHRETEQASTEELEREARRAAEAAGRMEGNHETGSVFVKRSGEERTCGFVLSRRTANVRLNALIAVHHRGEGRAPEVTVPGIPAQRRAWRPGDGDQARWVREELDRRVAGFIGNGAP